MSRLAVFNCRLVVEIQNMPGSLYRHACDIHTLIIGLGTKNRQDRAPRCEYSGCPFELRRCSLLIGCATESCFPCFPLLGLLDLTFSVVRVPRCLHRWSIRLRIHDIAVFRRRVYLPGQANRRQCPNGKYKEYPSVDSPEEIIRAGYQARRHPTLHAEVF